MVVCLFFHVYVYRLGTLHVCDAVSFFIPSSIRLTPHSPSNWNFPVKEIPPPLPEMYIYLYKTVAIADLHIRRNLFGKGQSVARVKDSTFQYVG